MNELEFEARHQSMWDLFEKAIAKPRRGAPEEASTAMPTTEVPRGFRQVVAQLALARDRQYRTSLIDRLHDLVISAHLAIHGARARRRDSGFGEFWQFMVSTFPAEARREWPYLLVAAVAFFGPFLGGIVVLQWFPDFVHYIIPAETLARIQSMYAPGNARFGMGREADSDVVMFGFYIANNVRIDLQSVAGGVFFGLGTLASLIFNGGFLGAISGHLTQVGYGENFWGFVAGHSAPELLGLVLAGAAGLRIGFALVAPGRLTRGAALRAAGPPTARLLYGAAMMTIAAAVIEAYWSSRVSIPFGVKIGFGAMMWAILLAYLAFGGRERGP
jgi:uncharacterized membrane protein SpoIIM required for sporulation